MQRLNKVKIFFFTLLLYFSWCDFGYGSIEIDPIRIELSGVERKTHVKLYNNSSEQYVYRTGITRRVNDSFYKDNNAYLIYPPVGILKSKSNVELGIVKIKNTIHKEDEKKYIYIQLIPKEKEFESNDLIIPLTTTILVEIKKKE